MAELWRRAFSGQADIEAMAALCKTLRDQGQRVYPIAADLYEELADEEVQNSAGLWIDYDGQLRGFGYVDRCQNLVDVFSERHVSPELEQEIIDRAVEAAQARNRASQETATLDASALEDDAARIAMLKRHGFEPQEESSLLLCLSNGKELPEANLPKGFSIRPMGGMEEIDAYVELHRAAFGTGNMDVDYRRAIMSAPDYLPELDLVAVAANGALAGFCVCQVFPDDGARAGGQREGWTDPVGVHPDYRGKGLAKALILRGASLLRERGIDTVLLGTSSLNEKMLMTARSLGFTVATNTVWFCKKV